MTASPLFWSLALLLLLGTLAILVIPLLRRSTGNEAPADQSAATAVFRDHKRQIEADHATGSITHAERDAALTDLTARFGAELAVDSLETPVPAERPRFYAALALVACIPVIAGVLYFSLGNPAAMIAAPAREPSINDPQIIAMVDGLATRLQANPEDGEGWAMLARSYRALGRFEASAVAYAEAAKRLPPSAPLLTDWSEAIAQTQGKSLVGQPTELLDRALVLDPAHPKALALRGSAAMERNDPATAAAMWKRLKAALPPGSPEIAQVDAALARIAEAPGAEASAPAAPTAAPPPRAAVPATTATATPPAAAAGMSVEGRVEVDPKLARSVSPGDTVFIFARDPEGPRMPLAAMKIAAAELPKSFALTDAMAMVPTATISKAKSVVIEARISKTGNVALQPGDLSGMSAPVAPGARNVRVNIDRVAP